MSRRGVEAAAAGAAEAGDTEGISEEAAVRQMVRPLRDCGAVEDFQKHFLVGELEGVTRQQWSEAQSYGTPLFPPREVQY